MIAIHRLEHFYPGSPTGRFGSRRPTPPRRALYPLDLTVAPGEFLVLTGPNGGGKSTLFRILCGLLRPSRGEVTLGGFNPIREQRRARARLGVVFQKPALDPHLTVLENLRIHAELYGLDSTRFRNRLEALLTWTLLAERLPDLVATLSGGLARQVELVKALLHEPQILLMDEPTTGLDPGSRQAFLKTVQDIQKKDQVTVLMTSHIFSEAEEADSMAILQQGRLLIRDHPVRLKERLGREMLVIQTTAPEAMLDWLLLSPQAVFSPPQVAAGNPRERLVAQRTGPTEIRIEGPEVISLTSDLLARFRPEILSLAIKQPSLEDVYIHVTGGHDRITEEQTP